MIVRGLDSRRQKSLISDHDPNITESGRDRMVFRTTCAISAYYH